MNKLAFISLVLSIMILVIAPLFAVSGIIENLILIRSGIARQSLGFTHPNIFGMYVILACTSISVLRFGKTPLFQSMLLISAAILILVVSDSRSTAILAVVCFLQSGKQTFKKNHFDKFCYRRCFDCFH